MGLRVIRLKGQGWGICRPAPIAHWWVGLGNLKGDWGGLVTWQSGSAAFLGQRVSAGDRREAPGTEVKELLVISLSGSTLKDGAQGIWMATDSICNTLLNTP